jgi:hypothetical protein
MITNVIQSGGVYFPGGGTSSGAPPSNAGDDYLAVDADGGSAGKTAEQVRDEDITTLFAGMTAPNVRVTRIRSDIKHSAMTSDLVLQASADQSELSNVRYTLKGQVNVPSCPCGSTSSSSSSSSSASSTGGSSSGWASTSSSSGRPAQPNSAPPPDDAAGSSTSGCEAIPQPLGAGDLAVGALGMVGLVLARLSRKRRS